MTSFTGPEQRFVLAEIIKSSSVDIHILANFVKLNGVMPDWYNMQLPNGRNLNQCIKFAQSLSIPTPAFQQPASLHKDYADHGVSDYSRHHKSVTSPTSHTLGLPSVPSGHFNILPRPPANGAEENKMLTSQVTKSSTRKRGRPSRSETSRRDLAPRLPPPIAPRPPLPIPGSNAPTPRTILPAINRGVEPLIPAPLASPPGLGNGPRSKKKRRLNSPPTPVVSKDSPPPPPPAPTPPAAVTATTDSGSHETDERDHGQRQNSHREPTKTPTPECCP